MERYLGIDVHSKSSTIYVMSSAGKKARRELPGAWSCRAVESSWMRQSVEALGIELASIEQLRGGIEKAMIAESRRIRSLAFSKPLRGLGRFASAWDGRGHRVLLSGGKKYEGAEQVPLGDFWAWDGARWERLDG